ncbi:MAG: class I SAM-dependent methyltransferase [Candidatus Omnitrophica bacterium]|nr:class I SAM-dependent methyltransferase [Candidatus Omnitrophota bacterium]
MTTTAPSRAVGAGTACPVCAAPPAAPRVIERHGDTALVHCAGCDVVYSDPMPSVDGPWYEGQPMYVMRDRFQPAGLLWNHRQFLRDLPARGGRLLDVGCGTGAFLAAARRRGYEVSGVDFDQHAIGEATRRHGLSRLYAAPLETLRPGAFDVVTAFEVLEHSPSPRAFLQTVHRLVVPGGWLALSVPYRDRRPAFRYHWDAPPHHLTRWSRRALERAVVGAGFRVERVAVGMAQAESWLHQTLQFGVASRALGRASGHGRAATGRMRLARTLYLAKHYTMKALAVPVNGALTLLGDTGHDLYLLAQRSGDA